MKGPFCAGADLARTGRGGWPVLTRAKLVRCCAKAGRARRRGSNQRGGDLADADAGASGGRSGRGGLRQGRRLTQALALCGGAKADAGEAGRHWAVRTGCPRARIVGAVRERAGRPRTWAVQRRWGFAEAGGRGARQHRRGGRGRVLDEFTRAGACEADAGQRGALPASVQRTKASTNRKEETEGRKGDGEEAFSAGLRARPFSGFFPSRKKESSGSKLFSNAK
ncbi:hypothetical protein Taro_043529 [Colocasia esculenta]|uniref:Uncharacterized protein n=1 Tax=Colocasia esculenta TaxID=4460 RepID=A0A843X0V9_COLES|nr:hypothetical protein [Colocasia esculenta]